MEQDVTLCSQCIQHPPPFDRTIALCHYQDDAAKMIIRLKFQHQLAYAPILGHLLCQKLRTYPKPEHIIPVPLHRKRLQARGFNQAIEIAKPIAQSLQIPIDITHCQRLKNTLPQTTLSEKLRKKNVHHAFHVSKKIRAKHVAILDDVVTTGHTVTEFAKALQKQGIPHIDVWCFARAHG